MLVSLVRPNDAQFFLFENRVEKSAMHGKCHAFQVPDGSIKGALRVESCGTFHLARTNRTRTNIGTSPDLVLEPTRRGNTPKYARLPAHTYPSGSSASCSTALSSMIFSFDIGPRTCDPEHGFQL